MHSAAPEFKNVHQTRSVHTSEYIRNMNPIAAVCHVDIPHPLLEILSIKTFETSEFILEVPFSQLEIHHYCS